MWEFHYLVWLVIFKLMEQNDSILLTSHPVPFSCGTSNLDYKINIFQLMYLE